MKKLLAVALLSISAAACSTAYQSSDSSITGGFSETRLTPDSWRVLVEGNGLMLRSEAEQFLMRRAAELTLEQGKRYFVLDQHDAWDGLSVTKSGTIVEKPRNAAIVTAVDAQSRETFDAVAIINETDEAAGHRLSSKARATLQTLINS